MTQHEKPTTIRLEGISKTFYDRARGTVQAVRTVDLEVQPGELTTLLGPSGCGKTTLLRMVAGFEQPTTGKIVIAGRDQTNVMANQRDIGFVFQNYALFPHMTVFDNVAYGLKLKGVAASRLTPAVGDVLDMVGLTGMERRFPNQLSGGEQQRVALARVIVTRPRVLLFDEPLSNLDAKRRVQMREEIRQLQKTLSITSLYVTHDQEEALAISDRIVVMNKGQIQQIGTPQQIYGNPRSVFVANFVGKSNVLPATVKAVNGESIEIDSGGQTFRVRTGQTAGRTGDDVFILIRPEAVNIEAISSAGDGALRGQIKSIIYLGEKAEYDLEVDGRELKAVVYDPQKTAVFEPGTEVAVQLPEDRMSVVDD